MKDSKVVKGVWVSKEEGVRPFEPGPAPGPAEPVKADAAKAQVRPAAVDSTGKARPEAEQHALNHAIPAPKTSAEPILAQKPSTEAVAKAAKDAKALEPLKVHEAKAAGSPAIWRGTISTETISQGGGAENAPGDVKQTSGVRRIRPIGG